MKIKVSHKLRAMLSKHFVNKILPGISEPLDATKETIELFWKSSTKEFKVNSLSFFSPELIDLVNKTNSKLLYAELLAKASEQVQRKKRLQAIGAAKTETKSIDGDDDEDYSLLNAFEMLWAPGCKESVDQNGAICADSDTTNKADEIDLVANQPINEMDLVEIRSHGGDSGTDTLKTHVVAEETKKSHNSVPSVIREEVKGFALTVKESYTDNILKICHNVRPQTFLSATPTDMS